jgi:hypothetical protein
MPIVRRPDPVRGGWSPLRQVLELKAEASEVSEAQPSKVDENRPTDFGPIPDRASVVSEAPEGFATLIDEPLDEWVFICIGMVWCEDCGEIHFIEAPAELQ